MKSLPKKVDLIGQRFGRITVIGATTKQELEEMGKSTERRLWWGRCDCGNMKTYTTGNLKGGKTTSCGCYKTEYLENELKVGERFGSLVVVRKTDKKVRRNTIYEFYCENCNSYREMSRESITKGAKTCGCSKYVDLTGQVFGRLTVIRRTEEKHQRNFKWECKCECGNIVKVAGGALTSGATKSCGCLRIDVFTGENNPNWNPDLTDEEREKRRCIDGDNHKKWSAEVLRKDNYTCQCCHKRHGDLNAHHLDGYHWCKERRYDVTNGVTLCYNCHREFHKRYGYKNNTEDQFKEYIESLNNSTSE